MGGPTFLQNAQSGPAGQKRVMIDLSDEALAANVQKKRRGQRAGDPGPRGGASPAPASRPGGGHSSGKALCRRRRPGAQHERREARGARPRRTSSTTMARTLQRHRTRATSIEGFANRDDGDKQAASLERANRMREQLIRAASTRTASSPWATASRPGHAGGVTHRRGSAGATRPEGGERGRMARTARRARQRPIRSGRRTSSPRAAMTVPRGTSAMVSILDTATDGEVVYLYDPESARGNAKFPFQSLRLRNPTDSELESGPVTVFGDGRFVGEGMSEPIPAHSSGLRALRARPPDRRRPARTASATRSRASSPCSAASSRREVQHTRKTTLVLHNRLPERAIVYVRHTRRRGLPRREGARGPPSTSASADLFRVDVDGAASRRS